MPGECKGHVRSVAEVEGIINALHGSELDYWVGRAFGMNVAIQTNYLCIRRKGTKHFSWQPSICWEHLGPLLHQCKQIEITTVQPTNPDEHESYMVTVGGSTVIGTDIDLSKAICKAIAGKWIHNNYMEYLD